MPSSQAQGASTTSPKFFHRASAGAWRPGAGKEGIRAAPRSAHHVDGTPEDVEKDDIRVVIAATNRLVAYAGVGLVAVILCIASGL